MCYIICDFGGSFMKSMNDIYMYVDFRIVERDFWEVSMEEKKKLIDEELKKYIVYKMKELDSSFMIPKENNLSVMDLLKQLSLKVSTEQKHELSHFTHYILKVVSALQSYYVVWFIDDTVPAGEPVLECDSSGLWQNIKTRDDIDSISIFSFVYDAFQNQFMISENLEQQKILNLVSKLK